MPMHLYRITCRKKGRPVGDRDGIRAYLDLSRPDQARDLLRGHALGFVARDRARASDAHLYELTVVQIRETGSELGKPFTYVLPVEGDLR